MTRSIFFAGTTFAAALALLGCAPGTWTTARGRHDRRGAAGPAATRRAPSGTGTGTTGSAGDGFGRQWQRR